MELIQKHFEPETCWVTDFEKVLLNDSSIHTFKCINHKLALKSWNETNYTKRRLPLHLAVIINTICKLILNSNVQMCFFTFLGIETLWLALAVLYLILIFKYLVIFTIAYNSQYKGWQCHKNGIFRRRRINSTNKLNVREWCIGLGSIFHATPATKNVM